VFAQSWSILHQITEKQIRLLLLLLLFLVSLVAYILSYGCKICMHTEKELHGRVGIATLACRTRFLDPIKSRWNVSWSRHDQIQIQLQCLVEYTRSNSNPATMSRGLATIKLESSCNVSWSSHDQIPIQLPLH
jgi:hypothetical protein